MLNRVLLFFAAGTASCFAGSVIVPTPEPATFVLVGGGILVAAGIAKFRKRS